MRNVSVTLLLTCFSYLGVYAQVPIPNWPATNGDVNTIVQSNNTVYIGGTFTSIGPSIAYGSSIDINTATPNTTFSNQMDLLRLS